MPFCRQGFAPPPATRERFFVADVACREFASAAISAWKRTPGRFAGVVRAAGSSTDPSGVPSALISGALPAGAVGSGRGSAFGRAWGRTSAGRRSSRVGSGRTTRVTGRATARRVGGLTFVAARPPVVARAAGLAAFAAGLAAFAAALAGVAFVVAVFFAAGGLAFLSFSFSAT